MYLALDAENSEAGVFHGEIAGGDITEGGASEGDLSEVETGETGTVGAGMPVGTGEGASDEVETGEEETGTPAETENGAPDASQVIFDLELQTREELYDAVPKITFVNRDYVPDESAKYPYYIKVNTVWNCVTVYGLDENGEYTVPVRAMVCSVAREGKVTPLGTFTTSDMYAWRLMVDSSYAQYAVRFNGKIMFHAVPCGSMSNDDLETEEFNQLGSDASLGCVRLCAADAKWIYDNCPAGTGVQVYENPWSPGPLGKPQMVTIPEDSPCANWDPTDPDENNPWNLVFPSITTPGNLYVKAGTTLTWEDLMEGVKASDTMGEDITRYVGITEARMIHDNLWMVTYYVADSLGKTTTSYRMIYMDEP